MSSEIARLDRAPHPDPAWPDGARRRGLVRELIFHSPRLGLYCADVLSRALHRLGRTGPTARELGRLVSASGPPRRLDRLARDIAASSFKSECLDLLKHRNGAFPRLRGALLDHDATRAVSDIRGPTVVATFHAGPLLAVRWALELAAIPTLVLAYDAGVQMDAGHRRIDTREASAALRASVILQAVAFLKRHETSVVLMAPDGGGADRSIPVELLGGRMSFRPGAAAIARLAGAKLLPMLARWTTATRVGLSTGEARSVAAREDEPEATHGLARFLEARFKEHPEELSTFYVSRLTSG